MKEVLNNFYLAITNEEEKAELNTVMDELKTNAAELMMKELETKKG